MRFFSTLKNSVTSTQFYLHLRNYRLRESAAYWLKFYTLLLVLMLIPIILSGFVAQSIIDRYYPTNLKIMYASGGLQVEGAKLPYSFSVANTKVNITPAEITFTTPDGQTIADKYGDALQGVGPFTINKDDAAKFVPEVLPAVAVVCILAFTLFVLIFRVPLVLLYALLIRSIMALFGKRITYKEVLQMALHASVVAELVNIAVVLIYRTGVFPMFDLAFFGVMILALRSRPTQIARIG